MLWYIKGRISSSFQRILHWLLILIWSWEIYFPILKVKTIPSEWKNYLSTKGNIPSLRSTKNDIILFLVATFFQKHGRNLPLTKLEDIWMGCITDSFHCNVSIPVNILDLQYFLISRIQLKVVVFIVSFKLLNETPKTWKPLEIILYLD